MKFLTVAISLMLFAEQAIAQDAPPSGGGLSGLLPLIAVAVFAYFLLIRPQMKQQKSHDAMVSGIKRRDKVILSSGIEGMVTKIDDANKRLTVEIAKGVEVVVCQDAQSIRSVESKTPANDDKPAAPAKAKKKAPAKKPAAKKAPAKKTTSKKKSG